MKSQLKHFILKFFSLALVFGFLVSCGSAPKTTSSSTTSSLTSPSTPSAARQPADVESRQDIYMQHLRNEGYSPNVDEDGDIAFRVDNLNYYISIARGEPSFTRIFLPMDYALETDADKESAALMVSYANSMTRVVKAYLTGANNSLVFFVVEIILENPNDFAVLFSRILREIQASKEIFES